MLRRRPRALTYTIMLTPDPGTDGLIGECPLLGIRIAFVGDTDRKESRWPAFRSFDRDARPVLVVAVVGLSLTMSWALSCWESL